MNLNWTDFGIPAFIVIFSGVLFFWYNKITQGTLSNYKSAIKKLETKLSNLQEQDNFIETEEYGNLDKNKILDEVVPGPHKIYQSITEAKDDIHKDCLNAQDIKILANKGLEFIGTDNSIVSTIDLNAYKNLKKIRTILLSCDSHWINEGLMKLRKHESLDEYKRDVTSSHQIVSGAINKFLSVLPNTKTGLRYYSGEPIWRMIITEKCLYMSNYADPNQLQVINLPVYRFDNIENSLYPAFNRYFNYIWHRDSRPDKHLNTIVDFTISAGGIVYTSLNHKTYILLLKRDDNNWVLPKGHKKANHETIENCAIREVSEESGIAREHLKIDRLLEMYTDSTISDETKVVHIFQIIYTGKKLPDLKPDIDHREAKWFETSEEIPILYYPYQATILAEFIESNINKSNSTS